MSSEATYAEAGFRTYY